jgi:hypothetical protein
MKFAFFVAMGGVHVPVADMEPERMPYPESWPWEPRGDHFSGRARLTPDGVLQLAKMGHFLSLSSSSIDDKSKADVLQKLIVGGQVTWMVTQCIARAAYGLPLTLLEIHTMAHVTCAFVMLLLWVKVRF